MAAAPQGLLYLLALYETNNLWRIVFDGNNQNSDVLWKMFEGPLYCIDTDRWLFSDKPTREAILTSKGEPGYCHGVFQGLNYCLRSLGEPMTPAMWERMHALCINGVKDTIYSEKRHLSTSFMTHGRSMWYLRGGNDLSLQGLRAALERMRRCFETGEKCDFFFLYGKAGSKETDKKVLSASTIMSWVRASELSIEKGLDQCAEKIFRISQDERQELLYSTQHIDNAKGSAHAADIVMVKAQQIINKYYDNLASLNASEAETGERSERERLRVIVEFHQDLAFLHPFIDGNGRLGYLLLQKMLLENGFPPAILLRPTVFMGYSVEELIEMVVEGMEITKAYADPAAEKPLGDWKMSEVMTTEYARLQRETGLSATCEALLASCTVTEADRVTGAAAGACASSAGVKAETKVGPFTATHFGTAGAGEAAKAVGAATMSYTT